VSGLLSGPFPPEAGLSRTWSLQADENETERSSDCIDFLAEEKPDTPPPQRSFGERGPSPEGEQATSTSSSPLLAKARVSERLAKVGETLPVGDIDPSVRRTTALGFREDAATSASMLERVWAQVAALGRAEGSCVHISEMSLAIGAYLICH
jgi:hypothetical protein